MGALFARPGVPELSTIFKRLYRTPEEEKRRKLRYDIWKSVILVSVAFMMVYTSFHTLLILHSSANMYLSKLTIAITVGVTALSAGFLPVWVIAKIGHRATTAVCMLTCTVFVAAQFYPADYTMVPAAVVIGVLAAPLWTAKCSYLARLGRKYAEVSDTAHAVCVTRFFGIFFLFYQASLAFASVIATEAFSVNSTEVTISSAPTLVCGFRGCPAHPATTSHHHAVSTLAQIILTGVFFSLTGLAAFIVARYANTIEQLDGEPMEDPQQLPSEGARLLAPLRQSVLPQQLLLAPLTLWSGGQQAFMLHVFTEGFVSCALGPGMVGYVVACYACNSGVCSAVLSHLSASLGRVTVLLTATLLSVSMIVVMLNWAPQPTHLPLFFILAGGWGIADAVWHTQLDAMYAILFPTSLEGAFSVARGTEAAGFLLVFLTSTFLCVDATVYALLMLLFTGTIGYACLEVLEHKRFGTTDRVNMQPLK